MAKHWVNAGPCADSRCCCRTMQPGAPVVSMGGYYVPAPCVGVDEMLMDLQQDGRPVRFEDGWTFCAGGMRASDEPGTPGFGHTVARLWLEMRAIHVFRETGAL